MKLLLVTLSVVLIVAVMLVFGQRRPKSEPPELSDVLTTKSDGSQTGPSESDTGSVNSVESQNMEKATFAAGCFWGVEAAFRQVKGVISTQVGYTGGHLDNPTYRDVCSDSTGHAEAVEVTFDPTRVSYADLLKVFWENHDPTTLNRQGPDYGSQYRSAIFYHNDEQKAAAERSKAELEKSGTYRRPIVTEIVKAGPFWRAEEYHQQYLEKRGLSSCKIK